MVRRVLGLIREESEGDGTGNQSVYSDAGLDALTGRRPGLTSHISQLSPLKHGMMGSVSGSASIDTSDAQKHPSRLAAGPQFTSMFSLLSHPSSPTHSATSTPPATAQQQIQTISHTSLSHSMYAGSARDLRPGIIEGLQEILDELLTVDDQIASYALDHIHSNEIILTHGSSLTVQKFLLKAAAKRTFTVILAEGFPNDHEGTHARVMGMDPRNAENEEDTDHLSPESFQNTLTSAGINVILIPDAAVYALMSRVNKVILGTHAVLANGGLLAAAGARTIAKAANEHSTPVVIVTGVYKLSPVYPFDWERLVELGDPSKVVSFDDPELVEKVEVLNPIYDYVPAELVDLYVTNLYVELLFSFCTPQITRVSTC